MNKTYKKTIWKSFIEGVNQYELVKDYDRIAVLLTEDDYSLLTLLLFEELKQHGKIHFTPVYFSTLPQQVNSSLRLKSTVLPVKNREEFLCRAKKEGCNKIVETTHFEEVANQVLVHLLHHGCMKTVLPKEKLKGEYEIIRPLYLVKEEHIRLWEKALSEEISCFFWHERKVDGLIKELLDSNPKIINNVVKSMENVNLNTIISYHKDHETVHFLDRYDLTDL